jgi:methyl-accepting chemotaxis protein
MRLPNLRLASLSVRIPLLLMAGAFAAALAVGINSHFQSAATIIENDRRMANSISNYRAGILTRIGEQFTADMRIMAASPTIREAYEFIEGVYRSRVLKDDTLQRHYVGKKPPSGQTRADYLGQDDRSAYAVAHRRWHPVLRSVALEKKLYDLFLITPDGEVIYTVEKESDFATNLRSGPWRNTGLARAFEGALAKAATGQPHFEDFEPYAPSDGAAAAFLAMAMRGERGEVLGVVAIQLPDSVVSNTISAPFGDNGTSYALGADGRLRTAVSKRGEHKIFAQGPYGDLIREAQGEQRRAAAFMASLDGREAYIAMTASEFLGKT